MKQHGAVTKLLKNFHSVSSWSQQIPLGLSIEAKPQLVSKRAAANVGSHFPGGGSWKQLEHYRQIWLSGEVKMFDYDDYNKLLKKNPNKIYSLKTNMKVYGQEKPPIYPIDQIKDFPIVMVGGTNDLICSPGDYTVLMNILKENNSLVEFIECEFGHLSMLNPNFE